MNDGPLKLEVGKGDAELVVTGVETKPQKAQTPEEVMEKLNAIGMELRSLIVATKKLPVNKALEPYQDPVRSIAQGQAYLQIGLMWLRKAIEQKKEF